MVRKRTVGTSAIKEPEEETRKRLADAFISDAARRTSLPLLECGTLREAYVREQPWLVDATMGWGIVFCVDRHPQRRQDRRLSRVAFHALAKEIVLMGFEARVHTLSTAVDKIATEEGREELDMLHHLFIINAYDDSADNPLSPAQAQRLRDYFTSRHSRSLITHLYSESAVNKMHLADWYGVAWSEWWLDNNFSFDFMANAGSFRV